MVPVDAGVDDGDERFGAGRWEYRLQAAFARTLPRPQAGTLNACSRAFDDVIRLDPFDGGVEIA